MNGETTQVNELLWEKCITTIENLWVRSKAPSSVEKI